MNKSFSLDEDWFAAFQIDMPLEPRTSVLQPFDWLDNSPEALAELDNRKQKVTRKVARARNMYDELAQLLGDNNISLPKLEAEVADMFSVQSLSASVQSRTADWDNAVLAVWSR